MATIELSSALQSNLAGRVANISVVFTGAGTNNYSTTGLLAGNVAGQGNGFDNSEIRIMTGTIPSSGLLNFANANANTLIRFSAIASGWSAPMTYTTSSGNIVINTNNQTATTSGTATWFAIITYYVGSATLLQSIYGNIGAIGSGADLEMSSNNIVAGQSYRVTNLVLQFPSSWTY